MQRLRRAASALRSGRVLGVDLHVIVAQVAGQNRGASALPSFRSSRHPNSRDPSSRPPRGERIGMQRAVRGDFTPPIRAPAARDST